MEDIEKQLFLDKQFRAIYCKFSNLPDREFLNFIPENPVWCLMGNIEIFALSIANRPHVFFKTWKGELVKMGFYGETYGSVNINDMRQNNTIALISPVWKVFGDGTKGIRIDDPDTMFIFKLDYKSLLKLMSFRKAGCCFSCRELPGPQ
jgi:hypothetical protein